MVPPIFMEKEPSAPNKKSSEKIRGQRPVPKPKKEKEIHFFEKYLLTVDEASLYFHTGEKKMYEVVRNHEGAKWMIYNGQRIMIKKNMFAMWLDEQAAI